MWNPDEVPDWDPNRELPFLEQWFRFEACETGTIFASEEAWEWERRLANPEVEE
jgi:hypothetical protein